MNTLALISTAALLSTGVASASVTFSAPTYGADLSPIDGVDGWTQSEPNVDPVPDGPAPMFFVSDQGGNNFGYLSGYYAIPDAASFSVSRDFALPSATLAGSTLSYKAAVVDGVDFPERNNFGMTVSVGAVELLTLTLTPESQIGTSNWAVNYLFDGGSTTAADYAVVPNSLVSYEIGFTATGLDVEFGAGGVTTGFSGAPTGYNPAGSDDITVSFFWDQGPGADFGDNGLLIDDIQLVDTIPEPASAVLVLLGIAGIALRRRR